MHMILGERAEKTYALALLIALTVLFSTPFAFAQESDLRATIRAQLLSDPRTANLSEADLSAMVELLAGEAQQQNITSSDITWQPQKTEEPAAPESVAYDACGSIPAFLCAFNVALGFAGNDPTVPFLIGGAALALVWLLAEILHRHKKHFVHGSSGSSTPPTSGLYA